MVVGFNPTIVSYGSSPMESQEVLHECAQDASVCLKAILKKSTGVNTQD